MGTRISEEIARWTLLSELDDTMKPLNDKHFFNSWWFKLGPLYSKELMISFWWPFLISGLSQMTSPFLSPLLNSMTRRKMLSSCCLHWKSKFEIQTELNPSVIHSDHYKSAQQMHIDYYQKCIVIDPVWWRRIVTFSLAAGVIESSFVTFKG